MALIFKLLLCVSGYEGLGSFNSLTRNMPVKTESWQVLDSNVKYRPQILMAAVNSGLGEAKCMGKNTFIVFY